MVTPGMSHGCRNVGPTLGGASLARHRSAINILRLRRREGRLNDKNEVRGKEEEKGKRKKKAKTRSSTRKRRTWRRWREGNERCKHD